MKKILAVLALMLVFVSGVCAQKRPVIKYGLAIELYEKKDATGATQVVRELHINLKGRLLPNVLGTSPEQSSPNEVKKRLQKANMPGVQAIRVENYGNSLSKWRIVIVADKTVEDRVTEPGLRRFAPVFTFWKVTWQQTLRDIMSQVDLVPADKLEDTKVITVAYLQPRPGT